MQTTPTKTRVGIFGGSFNPPTIAHFQMALEIINLRYVDEVWIVPCGDRQDKIVDVDRFSRYKMCEIMLKEMFNPSIPIQLNDIEVKNGAALPSYELMNRYINEFPEKEFFFVIGSDLIEGMEKWENGKELKKEINFLIFLRTGYSLNPANLTKNFILIVSTFIGASSSEVRKRVNNYYKRQKLVNKEEDKFEVEENGLKFFSKEEFRIKRHNKKLNDFHDLYLGIYGIVSFGVIEYIKDNKLYS